MVLDDAAAAKARIAGALLPLKPLIGDGRRG